MGTRMVALRRGGLQSNHVGTRFLKIVFAMAGPMIISLLLPLAMGPGTDVKLYVTNAHGKPVINREIWLEQTNSTKKIRPFGVQWRAPDNNRYMHGVTDATGNVTISKAKWRTPLTVITRFGPRFDPYVDLEHADDPPGAIRHVSMDVMKLEGAVYAGGSGHVVIADDYKIEGRVTDFETGKPIANVPVYLEDTDFGHMGGYPLTDLDKTTTDGTGRYSFTRLPNCYFTVEIRPKSPHGIEASEPGAEWSLVSVDGGPKPRDGTFIQGYYGTYGRQLLLDRPLRQCDFRVSVPTLLTVKVNGGSKPIKGWTVWVDDDAPGLELSYSSTFIIYLVPGMHHVVLERHSDSRRFNAGQVLLKSGEKRTLEYRLEDIVGKRRNKQRH